MLKYILPLAVFLVGCSISEPVSSQPTSSVQNTLKSYGHPKSKYVVFLKFNSPELTETYQIFTLSKFEFIDQTRHISFTLTEDEKKESVTFAIDLLQLNYSHETYSQQRISSQTSIAVPFDRELPLGGMNNFSYSVKVSRNEKASISK